MANKIQIRRYLERKQSEAIAKLFEESKSLQEQSENAFFETYGQKFEEIKLQVIKAGASYDSLAEKIKDLGLANFMDRYSNPHSYFNELCSKLSSSSLKQYYIEVAEAKSINQRYEKKIEETKREYDNLIALCQANIAKDSLKLLDELGFNTSEIEVKKESTALITSIDAKKLFIN
ncbi:hypothetical protein [Anaerocolumna sp.]|uniref:hypothetical protein n=1 Tax=Anaerocolumna sp. TaxID=2041569 RepID=UPI0028AFB471|nr:hypothetical protein [Anaerocolumna sp.]